MKQFGYALLLFYSVLPITVVARADSNAPQALKVFTLNFNSEVVLHDTNYRLRDLRFPAILDWLRQNDPDVIFIQEGWNYRHSASIVSDIAKALGYDFTYRLDMGAPLLMYDSNGILAKKSLQMFDRKNFKLPKSALDFGDGKNWIVVTGSVSYGISAKLRLSNGETVYVVTTHLIDDSPNDRADQVLALNHWIEKVIKKDHGDPAKAKIIIAGDMNSTPDSLPVQTYLQLGYRDSWATAHPGIPGLTECSDPTLPNFNPYTIGVRQFPDQSTIDGDNRIDYVFTRGDGIQVLAETDVLTGPFDGVWMSDHFGLLATLSVNGTMTNPVANPIRDTQDIDKPEILNLTEKLLDCDSIDCLAPLLELTVRGPHGFVVFNNTHHDAHFQIQGPGFIFPSSEVTLDEGHVGSFSILQDGIYSVSIEGSGRRLFAELHVYSSPSSISQSTSADVLSSSDKAMY